MPEPTLKDLDAALDALTTRASAYTTARRYYSGDHPTRVARDKMASAFGAVYEPGPDNVCAAVVDAPLDRLGVTGFAVEGRADAPRDQREDDDGDRAWDVWLGCGMDLRSDEVHQAALRDGDSYVIVWERTDAPRVPQIDPNPADLVTVIYDEDQPQRIACALKRWNQRDGKTRINAYYPDRIEKYVSKGTTAPRSIATFERVPGDAEVRNPYGVVPVFHVPNNAPLGLFGTTELHNAYPSQDRLNKTLADLDIAREIVALVQRWVSGVDVPIDPQTGKPADLKIAWNRLLLLADPAARAGSLEGADLRQFLDIVNDARFSVARNTGTPLHYMMLTNDPPSGRALAALETRFVKKIARRQGVFGAVWADVMTLACRIRYGTTPAPLQTEWEPAETQDEAANSETAAKMKASGVPWRERMRYQGYTEQEITDMEPRWRAEFGQATPDADEQGPARSAEAAGDPAVIAG